MKLKYLANASQNNKCNSRNEPFIQANMFHSHNTFNCKQKLIMLRGTNLQKKYMKKILLSYETIIYLVKYLCRKYHQDIKQ